MEGQLTFIRSFSVHNQQHHVSDSLPSRSSKPNFISGLSPQSVPCHYWPTTDSSVSYVQRIHSHNTPPSRRGAHISLQQILNLNLIGPIMRRLEGKCCIVTGGAGLVEVMNNDNVL